MAKNKTRFVCSSCGAETSKWQGQCSACGEWNTLTEEVYRSVSKSLSTHPGRRIPASHRLNSIDLADEHRYATGLTELDRVLGGGIVRGSLVLLSGDPGIGKSTIMLQITECLCKTLRVLYISGEESLYQLKMRANRLGVANDGLSIMAETDMQGIVEFIRSDKPDLVMVDSIQTMKLDELPSSPGSIVQVRESTNLFMQIAKTLDIPIILVSHVNKDGAIAGPKVLEHIVDTVLFFEGERNHSYRILRAVKNRYGSTNEIGVFEMRQDGLREVENPSAMLLSGRPKNTSGTCVSCIMEGSRPILTEVQGLVTASGFGNPRRMATGFDHNRMNLLLAVLEKRAGFFFSSLDAYINVVGGLRLDEPAADLTVAMALVSSLKDQPVNEHVIIFGEVGLAGEVRAVGHAEDRIYEAARMGFTRAIIPKGNLKRLTAKASHAMDITGAANLRDAFASL